VARKFLNVEARTSKKREGSAIKFVRGMCVKGNCNRRERRIMIREQRKEGVRFTIRTITVRAG